VLSGSAVGLSFDARAQGLGIGDITSDPFSFYYAFYLPNQQMQAMRPRPMDSINQAMVNRQYYAQTDRKTLYDPISRYDDTSDPLHPYSGQGQERIGRPYVFARDPSNASGEGPSLYYGRVSNFFPGTRAGRGPNANTYSRGSRALSQGRAGRAGGGGGGG